MKYSLANILKRAAQWNQDLGDLYNGSFVFFIITLASQSHKNLPTIVEIVLAKVIGDSKGMSRPV
jgi:hypothetical protein